MLLISHNVFNSFKDMLENRKTLKAGSIFPVRQGSSLTKQTQGGLTHWVCLHAHSQFYHHIIKAGINRSGHLDYYSIFQWNGSNHHSNRDIIIKRTTPGYWSISVHVHITLRHTDDTQDKLRDGTDDWQKETHLFSFLFLFSFTCGSKYSSVGMMSVAPSE